MTTFAAPDARRPPVEVIRPDGSKQLAAGLATAAALVAIAGLGLSLDTARYSNAGGDPTSITRLAWGEQFTGLSGEDLSYASVTWGGPLVLATLLLVGAAVTALVAARADRGTVWETSALLSSVVGAGLLAGVLAVLVPFAVSDTAVGHYVDGASGRWGPLVGALALSLALASAAALVLRRGKPAVLATVEVAP